MRSIRISLLIFIFNSFILQAEFISAPLIKPFAANIYEARIGMVDYTTENHLRLDIGANLDLFQKNLNNSLQYGIGTEFFTYTQLRSESNFKFPVETIDYYFGANLSFIYPLKNYNIQSRLRVGHISTHLADGYENNSYIVLDGEPVVLFPKTYSREFIDLTIAVDSRNFRPYIGVIYNFHKIPTILNMFIPQVGFDADIKINEWLKAVSGLDFKLNGYDGKMKGMTNLLLGLEFRTSENRGILLKCEYFNGENYYGQFYNQKLDYFGLGFQFNYY